jgi:hydroxymethylpyrimidine/phosphomethylpyrimidine kinase
MAHDNPVTCVLSIAGSDSGAAAGIQADLKTISAFGMHGLTAITAITAQNSNKIEAVHVLSTKLLLAQLNTLLADFRIAAVKIGMLGSAENVKAVARWLQTNRLPNIVLDPVLLASSGRRLLSDKALFALRDELIPLVDMLTPNLPEAEALLARKIASTSAMRAAAQDLRNLGARAVLLKGGHLDAGKVRDYFIDAKATTEFVHLRREFAARGTGCTLASAIAAGLAQGHTPLQAVSSAERYVQACFRRAYRAGRSANRVLGHASRSRIG